MTQPENELAAKGRAALERIFGSRCVAEIIAASPVPLAEAFAGVRDLPMAEYVAGADRVVATAAAERRKRARQGKRRERNERIAARRR